jgi:hypothetical protein
MAGTISCADPTARFPCNDNNNNKNNNNNNKHGFAGQTE